ncbi:energy-coupling factor transporter ATPase [Oceanobacillus indicireducens]|nr:energy-coupling factor transporter ATPase [Oceanobacillus indicireducens]
MEIKMEGVSADYVIGPIRNSLVLQSIDLQIESGSYSAIVGHTGAGKSSLLKTINGLLLPTAGKIEVGQDIIKQKNNKQALKNIRKKVGMVFQFPEAQLFAETVEKDICFGPLNFGVPLKQAQQIAKEVMQLVGLPLHLLNKSPHSLSGGQKRRVAIAGILAMEPEILVLDEPGAGLDPKGKNEIMRLIKSLHQERNLTTILVTHDMDDVVHYADKIIVMENGRIVRNGDLRSVFSDRLAIKKWHLDLPEAYQFQLEIEERTGMELPQICFTVDELADALMEVGLA